MSSQHPGAHAVRDRLPNAPAGLRASFRLQLDAGAQRKTEVPRLVHPVVAQVVPTDPEMVDRQLTELSVSEFLEAVASAEQPVPPGGSVAALGAASAALIMLVALCSRPTLRGRQNRLG